MFVGQTCLILIVTGCLSASVVTQTIIEKQKCLEPLFSSQELITKHTYEDMTVYRIEDDEIKTLRKITVTDNAPSYDEAIKESLLAISSTIGVNKKMPRKASINSIQTTPGCWTTTILLN